MKKLITTLFLLMISNFAQANAEYLSCQIRTAKGADDVAYEIINILELTGVTVSVPNPAPKKIQIGNVNGNLVEISLSGYYAGQAILALTVTSEDGQRQESLGTAANVIGFTSEKAGQYFSVLCRQRILE